MIVKEPRSDDLAIVNAGTQIRIARNRAQKKTLGVYQWCSPTHTPAAVPQQLTGCAWFIVNRPDSAVMLSFLAMEVMSVGSAVAASQVRMQLEKFSFTGEPTATQTVPTKIDTNHAMSQAACVTAASTGMGNMVSQGVAFAFQAAAILDATTTAVPVALEWEPQGALAFIRPGEGIGFRQQDSGVATDPRRIFANVTWEEFELAAMP